MSAGAFVGFAGLTKLWRIEADYQRYGCCVSWNPIPASSEQFPWEALTWHRSPLQTQHEKMFRSAFPGSCEEHRAVNRRYLSEIEQILSQPGVYYSCLYRKIDSTIIDAEFLVVDPPRNLLILLSSDS